MQGSNKDGGVRRLCCNSSDLRDAGFHQVDDGLVAGRGAVVIASALDDIKGVEGLLLGL